MNKKRVLIVDDDKWICEGLSRLLFKKGLHVDLSMTGEGALEKLDRESFDLIMIDYRLSDMSGIEVLKEIRKKDAELPVIFLTGYGSENVAINAFKLGIADYFIKPYYPRDLENSVLEILGEADEPGQSVVSSSRPPLCESGEVELPPGVERAVKHIKDNYNSCISLDKISKVSGFSRSHFMYKFKEAMGTTFKDYLNHVRIMKAEEILDRDSMTVSEIAYKVGFNSLRQFERTFKQILGTSPTEYRREKGWKAIAQSSHDPE